jgi:hypothetical protein
MSRVETSMIFKTRSIQLTLSRPKIDISVQYCLACFHVRAIFSVVKETGEPMGITGVYCILCGLVVRVSGYRYRRPGFDAQRFC